MLLQTSAPLSLCIFALKNLPLKTAKNSFFRVNHCLSKEYSAKCSKFHSARAPFSSRAGNSGVDEGAFSPKGRLNRAEKPPFSAKGCPNRTVLPPFGQRHVIPLGKVAL